MGMFHVEQKTLVRFQNYVNQGLHNIAALSRSFSRRASLHNLVTCRNLHKKKNYIVAPFSSHNFLIAKPCHLPVLLSATFVNLLMPTPPALSHSTKFFV